MAALPSTESELSLSQLVIDRRLAPAETLARAALVQSETGEPLDAVLTRLGMVSERALAEAIAGAAGLRIASATDFPPEPVAAENGGCTLYETWAENIGHAEAAALLRQNGREEVRHGERAREAADLLPA